jgi:hypothetical protein
MSRAPRVLATLCLVANVAFVGCVALAMARYPGGTWFDPHAPGHDFWRNFLCDLLHHEGLDGRPNAGATLALIGMVCGISALGIALWLVPALSSRPGARSARWLGTPAAVGMLLVPLLPSDRFPFLHGVAVVGTGVPAFAAAFVALVALRGQPRSFTIGAALVLLAGVDFGLYVWDQFLGGVLLPATPALQRVATLLLVAFTTAIALSTLGAQSNVHASDQP